MINRAIPLGCLIIALFVHGSSSYDRLEFEWPCPNSEDIAPCNCVVDQSYHFDIDCSEVVSDEDVYRVFETSFPFDDVTNFVIDNPNMKNNIRNITAGMFGDKCFSSIRISNTNLSHIEDNVFTKSHGSLVNIKVHGNEITWFPFEDLKNFVQLTIVDVSSNKLNTISELNSDTVYTLHLGGNRGLNFPDGLNTFSGVKNLRTLRLNDIELTYITQNFFRDCSQLRNLYLSGNFLTVIEGLAINPSSNMLQVLNLRDNRIRTVNQDGISGLASDCELNLAENEIVNLYSDAWQPIFSNITTGYINLEDNPLLCGCDIKWLVTNVDYWDTLTEGTTCASGENIHNLDPEIITHGCPNETSYRDGRSYRDLQESYLQYKLTL